MTRKYTVRYIRSKRVWKYVASENYCCKIIYVIYHRKFLGTRGPKIIPVFASHQMTDHNRIDTLIIFLLLYYFFIISSSSPCLSCNFWTNVDKHKIFSSEYFTHFCDMKHNQLLSKRKFWSVLQCTQFLRIFQKMSIQKLFEW